MRSLTAVSLAALVLAGCAVDMEPADSLTSEGIGSANQRAAFDYFRARGLTAPQAAGIVGNLIQESGVVPTVNQFGGGPGRGIAQWSAGGRWDTDRGDNVVAFAAEHGQSSRSLELQLEFVWYELTNFSGYGLAELRASNNVAAATIAFQDRYEGCGLCAQSQRINYAEGILRMYGSDSVSSGHPTAVPPEPSGCGEIREGHGLSEGHSFRSCDGRFELAMQRDGNLVLYEGAHALWATGTNGRGGYVAVMQDDGNFVVYDRESHPLWASNTWHHAGAHIVVQNDGNLVVYAPSGAPVWASHTCCR